MGEREGSKEKLSWLDTMCGRYSLSKKEMRLISRLPPGEMVLFLKERFNIAPTQTVPVIWLEAGNLVQKEMRWGLQPKWSSYPIINAKSETLLEKPTFREAFLNRRCLIPADGFYEWRKPEKTPFRFVLPSREPFCFAGIWDSSVLKGSEQPVQTFVILTTSASNEVRFCHDRMPLIIPPESYDRWLEDRNAAEGILKNGNSLVLESYPVSTLVNRATNEDARCIEPWREVLF